MQCIRIPRRWTKVRSTFLALHAAGLVLVGISHADESDASVSPDQREASSQSPSAATGDPVIAALPFERGAGGDLVPNQEALKALLAESAQNPGGLLVIRPAGEMAGFDRPISPDGGADASQGDSSETPGRPGLEEGSAALLGVIHALRAASPDCRFSVLGLPIERAALADKAAAGKSSYGELLHQLDAFVSTRGLLQSRAVGDEQAWLKGAMPAAVRLANGRPILFRTPAGWQQRSLAIESLQDRDGGRAGMSAAAGHLPKAGSSTRLAVPKSPPIDETGARTLAIAPGNQTPFGPELGDRPFDPPVSAGWPGGVDSLGGPAGAMAPATDPLRGASLSEVGGGFPAPGPVADTEETSSDETVPDLAGGAGAGGAAASPRSFAIFPRALRAFAPLAIGGDLLVPRDFSLPDGAPASMESGSVAAPRPASASSGASLQAGTVRSPARPSISSASSAGSSADKVSSNNVAAATPSRVPASSASPAIATGSRTPASIPSAAIATGSNTPSTLAPPRPAAPPVLPAANSSNGTGSTTPAAPPPVDPVIPITPPTSSGSAPSTPPPPPSAPPPPRDWSTLPANVGNEHSRIGSHAPSNNYWGADVAFTNLIYSSVANPEELVRGVNSQGVQFFGTGRFDEWTGPAYYTHDGWPFRSDLGALSRTNAVPIVLCWEGRERMWSLLGLRGQYETPPLATLETKPWGSIATFPAPPGIAGRTFEFKATCYWEGQGIAVVGGGSVPATPTVSTVQFTGPDGQGPFGDGPRTMSRSTVTGTAVDSSSRLMAYIIESDPTGANPLRNLIVLISEVRDTATGEIVYAGFDHTTYRPFQLYPNWVESMRHHSHLRSLHNDYAYGTPTASQLIHEDTGLEYEWHEPSHGSTHLLRTGWSRPAPTAPGFDKGFAAINRPTHVGFGTSLRAHIELCNQIDADVWWCHPAPTVFVGTRGQGSQVTYARRRGQNASDPNQVGSILIDEEYVQGFTDEIEQHLKPGLKVYSEWVNEIWNAAAPYVWATRYAWTSAMRAIAPVQYGGDDGLWFVRRTLGSPAIYTGASLTPDANHSMAAFSAAASAKLAEGIRARLGSGSSREIVCVAAGQSKWMDRSAQGLGQFWAAMPKLFKQLDAVAHAPYRSWWGNSTEQDAQLAELGADGVWRYNEEVKGTQRSYAEFPSLALRSDSEWATSSFNYPLFLSWKGLALDHPQAGGYQRRRTPPNWPANQRRWNLELVTYEGGNHHIPGSAAAKLESYPGTMHPSYETFTLRYMETVFGHGPKGLTRDPASAGEDALYRPGMVPMGVVEDAEPLHDRFTFLITTAQPSFRHGMFWGLQWWNGHTNAPQARGAKEAVRQGIGTDRWWE